MNKLQRALGATVVTTLVVSGLAMGGVLAPAQAEPATGQRGILDPPLPDLPLPDLPLPDQLPQLTGLPVVGEVLTVTQPVWNLLPGDLLSTDITWMCDGSPIPGTEGLWQYVPTEAQAGCLMTAQVTTTVFGFLPLDMVTNALSIAGVGESAVTPTAAPTVKADKGTPKVGTSLSTSAPSWNQDGVTTTYQWLRNGEPIAGQAGTTYLLVADDLDQAISVRATGKKADLTDGVVTSNALTAVLGDALAPTRQPSITGTPALGRTLSADPGAWGTGETPAYTYEWRRDGTALDGATGSTYPVSLADVGRTLTVTVTATRPGYRPGTFRTAGVTVAKVASTLKATAAKKRIKKGQRAVLTLTLKAAGIAGPTGVVKIVDGKRVVKTLTFNAGQLGKRTTRIKLKPGVHRLKAVYAGTATIARAKAKVVKVTVRK